MENNNNLIKNENHNTADQPLSQDKSPKFGSTGHGLIHIIGIVPIQDFWQMGIVPTTYDKFTRKLQVVFSKTAVEDVRRAILNRLPDISIEWYKIDDSLLEKFYKRITQLYPTNTPIIEDNTVNKNLAPDSMTESQKNEQPETPELTQPAIPESIEPVTSESIKPNLPEATAESTENSDAPSDRKTLLFITPSGAISENLKSAISSEKFDLVIVKSLDEATVELERRPVVSVFIHENLHGKKNQFINQIQTTKPGVPVRYYRSEASLLLNETQDETTIDLVRQNLALLSRINARQESSLADHAASVAKFADRMAIQLGIPGRYRLMISTAAYLHNMAEEDLTNTDGLNQTDIISLSASKLESWGFLTIITRILRNMYAFIDKNEAETENVETICGYILTTSDLFCHLWPEFPTVRIETDIFQKKLERKLHDVVTPSVLNSLTDVIKEFYSSKLLSQGKFSVHLFKPESDQSAGLSKALQDAGFMVTSSSTIEQCAQGCYNSAVDMLIIRSTGSLQDVYDTLMSLALNNIDLHHMHTILLLDSEIVSDGYRLLSHGIEDIFPATVPHNAVVTKLNRIKKRSDEQYRHRMSAIERLGTHGSLADLSLIGILESLRSNQHPVRVSVTALGKQLTIYVKDNKVIAAECDEATGLPALMMGVSWRKGVWNFESVDPSEIPEVNIGENIDTVLISACTSLDHASKDV